MVRRFLTAALATVFIVIAILLIDGLIAETTGLSLPGELSAAIAIFIAFFVGGRIGGKRFFWLGIVLFIAMQVFSISIVFDAVRDIEAAAGRSSQGSFLSYAFQSLPNFVLNLFASIAGLMLGPREVSPGEQGPRNAS